MITEGKITLFKLKYIRIDIQLFEWQHIWKNYIYKFQSAMLIFRKSGFIYIIYIYIFLKTSYWLNSFHTLF